MEPEVDVVTGVAFSVVTESPEFCPAIGRLIGVVGSGGGVGGVTGGGLGRPKASELENTRQKVTP